ncbi:MAG: hypothetical protein AAF639_24645 [Chloroflexota bacterium]
MMKRTFKQCSLIWLEKHLGVREVRNTPLLLSWIDQEVEISDTEKQELATLQEELTENLRGWNELELAYEFIAPLLKMVKFSGENRRFFAERTLEGKIGDVELGGKPDGMIASGRLEPEQPYFCLHEYKREDDSEGDPAGQVLAAMLVAQEINQHEQPVYGCYIKGNIWYFMILQGLEYSISNSYSATREDIVDIFRILKVLKIIITRMAENTA